MLNNWSELYQKEFANGSGVYNKTNKGTTEMTGNELKQCRSEFEHFEQAIKLLQDFIEQEDKFINALKPFMEGHGWLNSHDDFQDEYISLLCNLFGDTKDRWIEYYVYECDLGRKTTKIYLPDGKEIKLKTIKQLWRLINEHN